MISKVKYQLSLCVKCLGCNRQESEKFEGVRKCDNFVPDINVREKEDANGN